MNKITAICAATIATNITGCTNLDPTLNGLLKVEPRDAPIAVRAPLTSAVITPSAVRSTVDKGCTELPYLKSELDVDTLYGRAMTRFSFKSPEQIAIYRKTIDKSYMVDQGYKHEKQPGAFYHLAQTVGSAASGRPTAMWLEFKFAKNGTGSNVTAEFCVDPSDPMGNSPDARIQISNRVRDMLTR